MSEIKFRPNISRLPGKRATQHLKTICNKSLRTC